MTVFCFSACCLYFIHFGRDVKFPAFENRLPFLALRRMFICSNFWASWCCRRWLMLFVYACTFVMTQPRIANRWGTWQTANIYVCRCSITRPMRTNTINIHIFVKDIRWPKDLNLTFTDRTRRSSRSSIPADWTMCVCVCARRRLSFARGWTHDGR